MNSDRCFEEFWGDDENFYKTDFILILDCCYGGMATLGLKLEDRTVEIVSSVGMNQKAHGNPSDIARIQHNTFTTRLANEVAQAVGNPSEPTISFSELVTIMRQKSHVDRLPEYALKLGNVGVRLTISITSRTRLQETMPPSERVSRHFKSSSSRSAASESPPMAVFRSSSTEHGQHECVKFD